MLYDVLLYGVVLYGVVFCCVVLCRVVLFCLLLCVVLPLNNIFPISNNEFLYTDSRMFSEIK